MDEIVQVQNLFDEEEWRSEAIGGSCNAEVTQAATLLSTRTLTAFQTL